MSMIPPGAPRSSFGIPQEMKDAMAMHREKTEREQQRPQEAREAEPAAGQPAMQPDEGFDIPEDQPAEPAAAAPEEAGAAPVPDQFDLTKVLDDLGIELTEDDLHNLLFKGTLEKRVTLVKTSTREFIVDFKTLTGEEMRVSDTMLSELAEREAMTRNGAETNRSMMHLAFGVVRIQGKDVAPIAAAGPEEEKLSLNEKSERRRVRLRKTAENRLAVLQSLSPMILDKMIRTHARISMACNYVVEDPNSPLLKRPSEAPQA